MGLTPNDIYQSPCIRRQNPEYEQEFSEFLNNIGEKVFGELFPELIYYFYGYSSNHNRDFPIDSKVKIRRHFYNCEDGRRSVSISSLWDYDKHPFAVICESGRDGDEYVEVYVSDLKVYKQVRKRITQLLDGFRKPITEYDPDSVIFEEIYGFKLFPNHLQGKKNTTEEEIDNLYTDEQRQQMAKELEQKLIESEERCRINNNVEKQDWEQWKIDHNLADCWKK
jgi:hypothetical protein